MVQSSNKKWEQKVKVDGNEIQQIAEKLNVAPLFVEVCFQRGLDSIEKIKEFISIDETWFHDPFLMYDMKKAIERITQAIQNNEQITIYGDYDADGITSTSLLVETLDSIGANVNYYLPNRFNEGYGPNTQAFETIINDGTKLIITVDNGVTGHEAITFAQENNVDVIVTDHHEIPKELPDAFAIIHPAHPKSEYPFKDLAGVGVALKIATALTEELPIEALELAAIGTIADLVSLRDENRAIVYFGLKIIKHTQRTGLLRLLNIIGVDPENVDEETVGFQVAPRLNAIGRLGDASPGVELLCTHEVEVAQRLAEYIDEQNEIRKKIVDDITTEAFEKIKMNNTDHEVILLADEDWHQGVLGIVASRIVEATNKPTLLFSIDSETNIAKGSGRSVHTINLYKALLEVSDYLLHFGGHQMAAGMSADADQLETIHEQLSFYVKKNMKEDILSIDAFSSIEDLTVENIEDLNQLRPFGTNNTRPLIACENVAVQQSKTVGTDHSHLKLLISDEGNQLDVISFRNGSLNEALYEQQKISIAGYIEVNEWNNFTKPQMQMTDVDIPGPLLIDQRVNDLSKKDFMYKNTIFVFYNQNTYHRAKDYIPKSSNAILLSTLEEVEEFKSTQEMIIVDCPSSINQFLRTLLNNTDFPVRCYFYKAEHFFLTGLPSRADFEKVYKYFSNHQNIDLKNKGHLLIQELKIESNKLFLIVKVFLEAKFVIIDNGLLNLVKNPEKVDLKQTTVIQNAKKELEAEKVFIYSSFNEIMTVIKQDNNLI